MAIVNRKYGYLFLAEPYCASRAVASALAQHEGSEVLDTWVHNTFPKLVELGFVKYHEPLYKMSVIRNPADYLVTKYHHLTGWHGKGFKAFLRSELERAEQGISCYMHANDVDMTLRYESLESNLNDVLEAKGAPPVKLSIIGQTAGKNPWQSYYSAADLEHIQKVLPDFHTFGYVL